MYLATVNDLSTRMVIGWQVADRMTTTLITHALAMAHRAGLVAGNAIFHSDRGSQYTSARFAEYAASIDVRLSVGAVGVCWDNAVAESFFSTLKLHLMYKLTDESSGTQNWMATAPLMLDTLRRGGILVADELDSALRPALLDFLIHAFSEPSINVNGAQLIFASHAFSALERAGELGLSPESFWSVEKTYAGESELQYILTFKPRMRSALVGRNFSFPCPFHERWARNS